MDINASRFDPGSGLIINQTPKDRPKSQSTQKTEEQNNSGSRSDAAIVLRPGTQEAFERADRFREQQQQPYREFNDGRSQDAIHAYNSHALESKRAEIHGLLGVDTYV